MDKSEQINELATALSKAQGCIKPAIKDSTNPFFKSQYADLASVWEACRKPLAENGLSVVQTIDGNDKLETTLLHSSGQFISSTLPFVAKDQTSQSIGSAITYARRYALSAMVGICPDDDDAEAAMGRVPLNKKTTEEEEKKEGETKEHWCPIHNTEFFKKGNMKGYAHPVMVDGKETGKWCNEEKALPPTVITPDGNRPMTDGDRAKMQGIVDNAKKGSGETIPNASQSPQNEQGTALKPEVVETITAPAPIRDLIDPTAIKNVGDLLNAGLHNFGHSRGQMFKILGVKTVMEIGDLQEAYRQLAEAVGTP